MRRRPLMRMIGGRMRLLATVLLFAPVMACGQKPTPGEADAGGPPPECTTVEQCGRGKPNFRRVMFCEHCFGSADTHYCEANECREYDLNAGGWLSFQFAVPSAARGAKGYTTATLNPIRGDGERVTCAAVLSSTDYADNPLYNARSSRFHTFTTSGGADPALVYPLRLEADPGADRLVVLRVTSEKQGQGTVMAQGCTEGLSVTSGETAMITLDVR